MSMSSLIDVNPIIHEPLRARLNPHHKREGIDSLPLPHRLLIYRGPPQSRGSHGWARTCHVM
jgi:hypothetical protein